MRGRSNVIVNARPVARYQKKPLEWFWPGHIPLGKITILSGDPNLGKSLLTLDMAARISSDRNWPQGLPAPKGGRALLLAAEDDVADTIRPRLEAAGANVDRIDVLTAAAETGNRPQLVSLQRDAEAIADLAATGDYRLIVIDPITAYLDGSDMNSQQEVRGVLHRLAEVAERARAAVVVVSHHRKLTQKGPAVYRTLGAIAFAAVARAVWNVVRDPADRERRLLVPVKMNLAPNPRGRAFRVIDPGLIQWDPQPLNLAADDVSLEALAENDETDRLREAKIWLHGFLEHGPRPTNDVKSAAIEAGIPWRSLWSAKKALHVKAVRITKNDHTYYEWRLHQDDVISDDELKMLMTPTANVHKQPWAMDLLKGGWGGVPG